MNSPSDSASVCAQDALDSFNDWFQHYHHSKPAKPESARSATFTERVAQEHRLKQYAVDLERWKHSLDIQTKVKRAYNG